MHQLKVILIIVAFILGAIPLNFIESNTIRKIDWPTSLANSKRYGLVRAPNENTHINDLASGRSYVAVLAESGATCHYYINGTEYRLRPINYSVSSRNYLSATRKSDWTNLQIDGKTWDWHTTVRKDENNQAVSCNKAYFLTERPDIAFYRYLLTVLIYSLYIPSVFGVIILGKKMARRFPAKT